VVLVLWKIHKFAFNVLKDTLVPVKYDCGKIYEELHDFNSFFVLSKRKRLRWARHVARIEARNSYRILVGKSLEN
jgi:hypothetical protein